MPAKQTKRTTKAAAKKTSTKAVGKPAAAKRTTKAAKRTTKPAKPAAKKTPKAPAKKIVAKRGTTAIRSRVVTRAISKPPRAARATLPVVESAVVEQTCLAPAPAMETAPVMPAEPASRSAALPDVPAMIIEE